MRGDARNRYPAENSSGVIRAVSGMPSGNACPLDTNARCPVFSNRDAADLDEEPAAKRHLHAAAPELLQRLAEDRLERLFRRRPLGAGEEERAERDRRRLGIGADRPAGRRGLRGERQRGRERQDDGNRHSQEGSFANCRAVDGVAG